MSRHLIRLRPRSDSFYLSKNRTVLATDLHGMVGSFAESGLFVYQTRMLSSYRYFIDGQPPRPLALSNVHQNTWMGYYIVAPPGVDPDSRPDFGPGRLIAAQTVEFRVSRFIGDGMHEDIDIKNFAGIPVEFTVEIELDADFADWGEVHGDRQQRGELEKTWKQIRPSEWELSFTYTAEHQYRKQSESGIARIDRRLYVVVHNTSSEPGYHNNRITFQIALEPQQPWHVCLNFIPQIEGKKLHPMYGCTSFIAVQDPDEPEQIFLEESASFASADTETLAPMVTATLAQARRDLASLRLNDLDHGVSAWTMAAGLPVYTALFGRDTLTASWQAAMLGSGMMQGTLAELAACAGKEVNDWRDEQPGRMIHQMNTGPLAALNYGPLGRYYGSETTSGFYPFVVSALWHWTGDKDLVRPYVEPALNALRWLDEWSDRNHDGFYEYLTRSSQPTVNQGWKDAADSIVDEDGKIVEPPIATCEEQSFVYVAKLHFSELLWWLGQTDQARKLYGEAMELKKRFNDVFWMEDEGFFAMGLDSKKRQIRSIASNPGHCLATGIVDESLVQRTASRLFSDEMFSGWGIRTLSSAHPAYNPYSYHRGSVWPVEQGTFAIGFARYGLHHYMNLLCRAQFEAAALFDFYRLPELFSGHPRDVAHPFPANYPNANSPQAWSASTVFSMLQAILGLYPYAPLKMLLIDPHLPDWLPDITLRDLRVGDAKVTIRFFRTRSGTTDYHIEDARDSLHVVRQPSPWSLTAGFAERVRDVLASLVH
ncbi:MAG: amylo-alpha-1,6-glucosidase [Acidobacteria bacterium]|nr:MAG: amylo-alpha-1,6-glucosidase [Acidobacteriota bacterium]